MSVVWIINQYASTPAGGPGGRTHHIARNLANLGHTVCVVGARWHHYLTDDAMAKSAPRRESVDGYEFVRVNVPRYAHAHDKKRVLNWLLFAVCLKHATRDLPKPDVVYYSSPSLIPARAVGRLARRHGATFGFEVRDIWPFTLTQIGGFSPNHPLIRYMQGIEDEGYAKADLVVTPLSDAHEHMASRGAIADRHLWLPNGFAAVDLSNPEPLPEALSNRIPTAPGRFLIGYVGTMGHANALETLVEAAGKVHAAGKVDFGLVFAGQGARQADLKARLSALGLAKICVFLGPVPKKQVASILAHCDAGFLGWHDSPLYQFGISPNKLVDYMYASLPILHAFSGAGDPVARHDLGITTPAGDVDALTASITTLATTPKADLAAMGDRGRIQVRGLDYAVLAQKLATKMQLNNPSGPIQ